MSESIIPEDKVVWGRGENKNLLPAAIVLWVLLAVVFFGIVGYGFHEGVTRERPPVTLLTPTTGG